MKFVEVVSQHLIRGQSHIRSQVRLRRQYSIFSAYSSPGVKDIKCEQSEVILIFYPGDYQEALSLDWIRNELVYKPLSFYKSHLKTPEYWDEVSDWKYIMRY